MRKGHAGTALCWCRPRTEVCEGCGETAVIHKDVALRPDVQPRAFSPSGQPVCPV